jgi:S1-C subfamily serine protease
MDSSRRQFLAAAGTGLTALAGCTAPATRTSGSDEPFADLYEAVSPSVVRLRVYDSSGPVGEGSGWLYADGTLVTNAHVVARTETVRAQFENGDWETAEILGTDSYSDLAALSVPVPQPDAEPLPFVEEQVPVGTRVAAVGSPLGLGGSLTTGVVSGQDRSLPSVRNFTIADAVQTDAALNPGNSGGPLVTLDGQVAGVVTQAGGENVGFAISAALTERVVPELVESGSYDHPYMGVLIRSVTPLLAEANGLDEVRGAYVDDAPEGEPAAGVLEGTTGETGVEGTQQPTGGDVIVGLDGTRVDTTGELGSYLALETSPGDTIDVTVIRDGERQTVQLTLGTRPEPR